MREIKFRGWDTKRKKMYSAEEMGRDELTVNPDGRGFVNVSGTDHRLSEYYPHILPMQFTGLTDKNGKEIYEGDKVRLFGGEYCQGCWEHDETVVIKDLTYGCFMMGESENIEIIGNIHEVTP
jgi:uncharacterized phage protein (TIGR01671 family)